MERDHVGDKARVALPEQIKHGLCHAQCVGEENKTHHFLGQSPWLMPALNHPINLGRKKIFL